MAAETTEKLRTIWRESGANVERSRTVLLLLDEMRRVKFGSREWHALINVMDAVRSEDV